jgi:mono/diheme cytochrome c family protein
MNHHIRIGRRLALWGAAGLVAAATVATTACTPSESQTEEAQALSGEALVERGAYLVGITGCHDCHSPKLEGMTPDLARALSGRPESTPLPTAADGEIHAALDLTAWTGPWGFSVASNLTPDPATGIGTRYTEAAFVETMRTGRKPNGTQIQPPMPSEVYQNMTDEDLRAIFAYLQTVEPIRNAVFAGLTPPGTP